jgi:hypothetical protein
MEIENITHCFDSSCIFQLFALGLPLFRENVLLSSQTPNLFYFFIVIILTHNVRCAKFTPNQSLSTSLSPSLEHPVSPALKPYFLMTSNLCNLISIREASHFNTLFASYSFQILPLNCRRLVSIHSS